MMFQRMTFVALIFALGLGVGGTLCPATAGPAQNLENTIYLDTKDGRVAIGPNQNPDEARLL
jgi:hypothetical protein